MNTEEKVLSKIIPSKEDVERIDGIAMRLTQKVRSYLDEHGIDAELKLVGSYSKGTYLSNPDLDLFIMFPMGTSREELVKTGLKIGEDVLHGTRMYAEHPYTSAVFEGVDVDLVPNIHIDSTDKLVTAVDRTPFHTEYVLSKLKEGQNNQIRLLKKFMKGIGTYGAEPNVRGFSGYLCELLVLKYGTFTDVLKAAAEKWRAGMEIVLEKKDKKIESAMVFYDPVDGKRNVASAVHQDTLSKFILAARDYLAEPSEKFFFPTKRVPLDDADIRIRRSSSDFKLIQISFDRPDMIDDNLYSQIWKTVYALKAKLDHFEFRSLKYGYEVTDNRIDIGFILNCDRLPTNHLHIGPPAWGKNSQNFLEKWNVEGYVKPFIEDGRWCVIAPRPYTEVEAMLQRETPMAGIGKDLDIGSMEVLPDSSTLDMNRKLVTNLLDGKPSWKN